MRLLIVSNRLPISTTIDGDSVSFAPASGGLATGLRGYHERTGGLWIGWPGTSDTLGAEAQDALSRRLQQSGIVPVYLSATELHEYYEECSNGALWPVFHYLVEQVPLSATSWNTYRSVNARFAEAIVEQYRPGDVVWIHDYQLLLVPGLVRSRLPDARIGFFLHIPFPAAEIFRILPWRDEILRSLLGADLIGFHTYSYVHHFAAAVSELPEVEPEEDHVWVGERLVRFNAFPMGINAAAFESIAASETATRAADELRRELGNPILLVAVDRLDYTKGIKQRLAAVESLLASDPTLRERLRLVQVSAPSRPGVASYQTFRREVEELIGRINGSYGTMSSVPIHSIHQTMTAQELAPLYRAADVMLVTPLRDGMNLVAKEFVASRVDERGVLVLSEFAGAVEELPSAVIVNAYDVDGIADGVRQAIAMAPDEQAERMGAMRRRVLTYTVHTWADEFMRALTADPAPEPADAPAALLASRITELKAARPLALLLDYDGTLVPIAATPSAARPDPELHDLLAGISTAEHVRALVVSGRSRADLDTWFGDLRLELWAEHGTWRRPPESRHWTPMLDVSEQDWMPIAREVMTDFAARTPGVLVEVKSASLAWHYRQAARGFGQARARELRVTLSRALAAHPVDILEGKKVVEVRRRGATKAAVVQHVLAADPPPQAILAIGDDRTDEEMFAALPRDAVTVRVGGGTSAARYRLRNTVEVRMLLAELLH